MAVTWVIVKDVGKLADVTDQHDRNDISLKRKEGRLFLSTLTVGMFPFSESQHGFQSSQ